MYKKIIIFFTSGLAVVSILLLSLPLSQAAYIPPSPPPPNYWTPNVDHIYSNNSGNVGIGATSPLQKLHVSGTIRSSNLVNTTSSCLFANANGDISLLGAPCGSGGGSNWTLSGTNLYNNNQTGNIGIGTTNPGARLDLGFSPGEPGNMRLSTYGYYGLLYSSGSLIIGYNAKANEGLVGNVLVANTNATVGYNFITIGYDQGIAFHTQAGSVTAGNVASNERMRINQGGNVGIGLTNPITRLDILGNTTGIPTLNVVGPVSGSVGADIRLRSNSTATNALTALYFTHSTVNTYQNSSYVGSVRTNLPSSGSTELVFATALGAAAPAEKVRIDANGNMGIGISPSYKLHVNGSIFADNADIVAGKNIQASSLSNAVNSCLQADTNGVISTTGSACGSGGGGSNWTLSGTNLYNNNQTGNVGIGMTTPPTSRLHVVAPSGTTALAAQVQNLQNAANAHGLLVNTARSASDAYALDVQSGGTSRLYVRSDGNIGIGTAAPTRRLALVDAGLGFDRITTNVLGIYTNNTERVRIDASGNVGIGTTNTNKVLRVNGHTSIDGDLISWSLDTTFIQAGPINATEITAGDFVSTPTICLFGDCRSSWPTGSGLPAGTLGATLRYDADWVSTTNLYNNGTNVGIGTTVATAARLTLADHTAATGGIRFRSAATAVDLYSSGSNILKTLASFEAGSYKVGTTNVIDVSRNIIAANGTLTSPSLRSSSYTTTGLSWTTGPTLVFITNAGERMRINQVGNVGIGLTNPITRLDILGNVTAIPTLNVVGSVSGSTGANIRLRSNSTAANALTALYFTHSTSDTYQLSSYVGSVRTDLPSSGSNALVFATALGTAVPAERVRIDANGNVGIGLTNPDYSLKVNGTVAANAYIYNSDRNLKTNIKTIDNPLEKITSLRGVYFNWKEDDAKSVGLIAQEVEKVFPELVDGREGGRGVQYGNLVAPLIEAIKEQQKQIEDLNARLKKLEAMMNR